MTQNTQQIIDLTETYFNQMQKETIEAVTMLTKYSDTTELVYETETEDLAKFLDSILGEHSTREDVRLTISNTNELPELLESIKEAKGIVTEQAAELKQTDKFTIEEPAELSLFEQTVLIAEVGYIKETNSQEFIVLDLQDTRIAPFESVPLFYQFNPMILNNEQVMLCNTEEFLQSVEQKPIPGISHKLQVDVKSVSELPFENKTCEVCESTYSFINTHNTYCHENTSDLSKIQREVVKSLVLSGRGEFVRTDDGWSFKLTSVPQEFAEWIEGILSDKHQCTIFEENDGYTLLTYPSNTFTKLVQWRNGDRKLAHSSSKEILSILFALNGTVSQREVFFTVNEDPDVCAEIFELFESFRITDGECVVSLRELEAFIGDKLPGFEDKWESNMLRFQEV